MARLAARWFQGWTWYAESGFSPPAPEPGYPMQRPASAGALRAVPEARSERGEPHFVLLFGGSRAARR
jgi:hypothetical protein